MSEVNKKVQNKLQELLLTSKAKKRKVAAFIADGTLMLGEGVNYNLDGGSCEDVDGNTKPTVVHAEVAAIDDCIARGNDIPKGCTIYVTHQPCENCAKVIKDAGIENVVVSGQFMKFDTGKLRYGLIPPSATEALASVLTYGAKKYKANNWKEVDDTDRYVDALYRHLEAWRNGENLDEESKLPHLSHALTNIAFLIALDVQN